MHDCPFSHTILIGECAPHAWCLSDHIKDFLFPHAKNKFPNFLQKKNHFLEKGQLGTLALVRLHRLDYEINLP